MQKNTKKKLFVVAVAVCLIAILSFTTLAWFSDADSVTNEFLIADSESQPDKIFSVDVWEPVDKDGDGEYEKEQEGLKYEDILPGGVYPKAPTVENTGAYDQYIRVHVTVTNADAWIAALGNGYDLGSMFLGHDEDLWTRYEVGTYNGEKNTYTMTFYLNKVLEPDAPNNTAVLFTDVKIPEHLTQNDMAFIGGSFQLEIVAEAVQTENLGENVDTAYEAFEVVVASGQEIDQIKP